MKNYKCFYNNQTTIVKAETTYKGQMQAQRHFQSKQRKKVNSYDITMMLLDVTHVADF